MTHRHAIPAEDKLLGFSINTESGRILLATSGETATLKAIEQGLAAASRLTHLAAAMKTAMRRQRTKAINAERDALRAAEQAERRNDEIRRARGLPTGQGNLAIPAVPA